MEKLPGPGLGSDNDQMELPPGFRFHPTDEELIIHYLSPKVLDRGFTARAIGEVDLNKVEPWDLPWKAKMGEREWYFFCMRDRKYPTGLRTNRATDEGYWKATGKDKEIHKERTLIGMKKTLVFYRGRAPKGEKTNWVMHEYRLEGKHSLYKLNKTSSKNEWVICRVFRKSSGGKKTHISGLARMDLQGGSNLPPLMECSDQTRSTGPNPEPPSHVTCFSEGKKPTREDMFGTLNNSVLASSSSLFPKHPVSDSLFPSQFVPNTANFQYPEPGLIQDESILRYLLHNNGQNMKWVGSNNEMDRRSYEDQEGPISSAGPVDLDCLWSY